MNKAQGSTKRVVSKGRFAVNAGGQITLALFGLGISVLGFVALIYCVLGFQLLLAHTRHWEDVFVSLAAGIILIVSPLVLVYFGVTAVKEAKQMDIGTPLTHANTADLPAPDSLVRASQEPMQTQEAVLLRASVETQERHEEQLLRAATGKQE